MSDTPPTVTSLPGQPLDMTSIAFAMAQNECGAKLALTNLLDGLGIQINAELKNLLSSPQFKAKYAQFVHELTTSGESFKLKARVQAEELLRVQWQIIHDQTVSPAVRVQAIENTVQWADLLPKKETQTQAPQAITIHIDLGTDKTEVIDVTPTPDTPPDALSISRT